MRRSGLALVALCLAVTLLTGCIPTVKVQAPEKPITIDLNVQVEQEVEVKLNKALEDLIQNNPELFGLNDAR